MATRKIKGSSEKLIYRNERYTKGVVSTNDPLVEGSFRRLINFKLSSQNASLENREPYITVPIYDLNNNEVHLTQSSILFSFNEDTEHAFILDLNQKPIVYDRFNSTVLKTISNIPRKDVVDGDTIKIDGQRYRLALIDAPELEDDLFKATSESHSNLGKEAKDELFNILEDNDFDVVQFDFQTEKIDEFGRPLVYLIMRNNNDALRIINFEMLENGYASIYGMYKFNGEDGIITFNVPGEVFYEGEKIYYYEELSKSIREGSLKWFSPLNKTYLNLSIKISENTNTKIYSKPKVYKIRRSTELYKHKGKLIRRAIKTFEVNENKTKLDLELFSDHSLLYETVNNQSNVTNSKYENQYLNFFVNVYDNYDVNLYRGIIELSRTSPNYEEGVFETFHLRTYQKPEMKVEIQDITNYKPNVADSSSIIPKTLDKEHANVIGITSPKVNGVFLSAYFDENLNINFDSSNAGIRLFEKYFKSNRAVYQDLDKLFIRPIYKAPVILNQDKKNYMYRWDIITANEIDVTNEEALKEFKPIFRSAWTDLYDDNNISEDLGRTKKQALKLENALQGKRIFTLVLKDTEDTYVSDTDMGEKELKNISITYNDNEYPTLNELNSDYETFLEKKLEDIVKEFEKDSIKINNKEYVVLELTDYFSAVTSGLQNKKETNSLSIDIPFKKKALRQKISKDELIELFEEIKDGKETATFLFTPYLYAIKNDEEDNKDARLIFLASQIKTLYFKNQEDRKTKLGIELNLKELEDELNNKKGYEGFFDVGFTAVFYLTTYESIDKLDQEDEFYDIMAYKSSSATYLFRKETQVNYYYTDFIRDKLLKESYAIKYSKYISSLYDRTIVYGNTMFKNTLFMSEEGSPYYFSLVNAFEFDYEIVHVNQFKDILLVFTINDIWVIYEIEETNYIPYEDEEGKTQQQEVKTKSFRTKKILYNISTEHKNKVSIQNLTRYITLLSNDVLYLIRPSSYISDETQFSLTILSQNIEAIVKDPLKFINERLSYYGLNQVQKDPEFNMIASDNFIKLYYSVEAEGKPYSLILIYDVLNNRWYEEDTISFGPVEHIYLLDSTTGYEMLTKQNNRLFFTYNTDKFKNTIMNDYGESNFDIRPLKYEMKDKLEVPINYYIDTGNIRLTEHLRKRYRLLMINFKNINSKEMYFNYSFTVDDVRFHNTFTPIYTVNNNNEIVEIEKQDKKLISENKILMSQNKILVSQVGFLDNFLLDFSNLQTSDIIMMRNNLLGMGRIPRVRMSFQASGLFYLLSYGIIYSEKGGK